MTVSEANGPCGLVVQDEVPKVIEYATNHPFSYFQGNYKTEMVYWWKLFGESGTGDVPSDFNIDGWIAGKVPRNPSQPKYKYVSVSGAEVGEPGTKEHKDQP